MRLLQDAVNLSRLSAIVVFLVVCSATPAVASSGTLSITSNTTLTANHFGNIVIEGEGITLDCADNIVFGPGVEPWLGGIQVSGNGATVKRCTVIGFKVNGLYSGGHSNGRYENNKFFKNEANGMHIDSGNGDIVIGNTSRWNATGYGIVFTGTTQAWIENNTAKNNAIGIGVLAGCQENILTSNVAAGNTNNGFEIAGINNVLTSNVAYESNLGFYIYGVNNSFVENKATSNALQGFYFAGATDTEIYLNIANNNLIGFELTDGSNGNRVGNNVANNNQYEGFKVYSSNSNTLFKNTANNNHSFGFLVFGESSYNKIIRNVAHDNDQLDGYYAGSGVGNIWSMNSFIKTSGF